MENHLLETYREGAEAFKANNYRAAQKCFKMLLDEGLQFADVHNMLGVIGFARGDYESAVVSLKKALELNPNYTEARLNLSVVLNDTGEYPDAARAFDQARAASRISEGQVDPFIKGRLSNLHAELGDLYHGMGLYDDALKEYEVALNLREEFPDVRTKLGVLYRDMGLHDQAIEEFTKVCQTHPHYVEATIQLGISHYGVGEPGKAKELWQQVLEERPGDPKATMYYRLVEGD